MDHWFLQCQLKPVQLHDEVSPVRNKHNLHNFILCTKIIQSNKIYSDNVINPQVCVLKRDLQVYSCSGSQIIWICMGIYHKVDKTVKIYTNSDLHTYIHTFKYLYLIKNRVCFVFLLFPAL